MTGRVNQCTGDPPRIRPIEPAHHVPKVDRDALGDARGNAQHLGLARRAAKAPGIERSHCRCPVDEGHWCVTWRVLDDLDGLGEEVASRQPGPVVDKQIDSGFSAQPSFGMPAQRRSEVLDAGSK